MNSEWECLRLAAKATDREKAFRDHWPAVETQLRQWGYPSWGIAQAHLGVVQWRECERSRGSASK